uniref:Link domain-containing protein n=1 Tax=Gouania willdenowi TaxID=441366 RepID=A0A8C5N870_GOUWI
LVRSFRGHLSPPSPGTQNMMALDPTCAHYFPLPFPVVAGVFQVTRLNDFNQPHYAFNASEARLLCLSLGVHIASKAQVETALTRGFETCRFGWIDEYLAVIPRIRALINCGKNQTGLVPWRASVKKKFDVFCFNESGFKKLFTAQQLNDTATDRPLNSSDVTFTSIVFVSFVRSHHLHLCLSSDCSCHHCIPQTVSIFK